MRLKKGVKLGGLKQQMVVAAMIIDNVLSRWGCIVTSGCEDAPGRLSTSKHKTGEALDFRAKHIPHDLREKERDNISGALTDEFDVVLHGEGENIHFHVEFDPR